jgi:CxxC motif-containing protein (DUF1111 family)
MKRNYKFIIFAGFSVVASTAISQNAGSRPGHPAAISAMKFPHTPADFGDPLPGLSTQQTANFTLGQAQFQVVDGPADGLGPIFNAQSCNACHTQPYANGAVTSGGASAFTETRAGTLNPDGSFYPLTTEDGSLFHLASLTPTSQEIVPPDATIVAHRKTTPLFGSGLIEAIPDATILAKVNSAHADGVVGRAAVLTDPVTTAIGSNKVGRFGWKAQESTLLAFSGDAYLNEMGITNRFFTTDQAPDGKYAVLVAAEPLGYSLATPNSPTTQLTPTTLQDLPENPALKEGPNNKDDIARFTDFMELLAPPPTLPLTRQAFQGQQLFRQINCVACHTPSMQTGPSKVSGSLAFQNVPLYSDLLLHHMGSLGDGIAQAAAQPDEMRTAPLWGLRARSPFLHDGRASTIDEAIRLHDGEANAARNRYIQLTPQQQQEIVAFLNSI